MKVFYHILITSFLHQWNSVNNATFLVYQFPVLKQCTISTQNLSMKSYSNHALSRHFSNEITLRHSYMLFTRLLSIVKPMQDCICSLCCLASICTEKKVITVLRANNKFDSNILMLLSKSCQTIASQLVYYSNVKTVAWWG